MKKLNIDKHQTISKDTKIITIVVSVTIFITIFAIFGLKDFLSLRSFQQKIIVADTTAYNQLNNDINSANILVKNYNKFLNNKSKTIQNIRSTIITPTTKGFHYNGATMVLDAMPTTYDYPATESYLQNMLDSINQGNDTFSINNNSGGQSAGVFSTSAAPVTFSISANSINYQALIQLVQVMKNSVRPITINSLSISGSNNSMTVNITAQLYYQSSQTFSISQTEIK